MTEAAETVLEVFIPGPGENPEDPQDMERSIFLGAAQEARFCRSCSSTVR